MVIQARLEEIFDLVLWEIKRSGYDRKLIAGMVLTGGGALLKNIALLAEFHTGLQTRLGLPTEHLASGYRDEISSPIYATGIGLLIHGIEMTDRNAETTTNTENETTNEKVESDEPVRDDNDDHGKGKFEWVNGLLMRTKEFFEATPDSEL